MAELKGLSELAPNEYERLAKLGFAARVSECKKHVAAIDAELMPAVKKYNAGEWQKVRRQAYYTVIAHSIKHVLSETKFELCRAVLPDVTTESGMGGSYTSFISGVMDVYYDKGYIDLTRKLFKGLSDDFFGAVLIFTYALMLTDGAVKPLDEHFAVLDFFDIIGRPFKYC